MHECKRQDVNYGKSKRLHGSLGLVFWKGLVDGKNINVIFLSKLKTTFQFISITLFLSNDLLLKYIDITNVAIFCLWITTILTIYTGFKYSCKVYSYNKRK